MTSFPLCALHAIPPRTYAVSNSRRLSTIQLSYKDDLVEMLIQYLIPIWRRLCRISRVHQGESQQESEAPRHTCCSFFGCHRPTNVRADVSIDLAREEDP